MPDVDYWVFFIMTNKIRVAWGWLKEVRICKRQQNSCRSWLCNNFSKNYNLFCGIGVTMEESIFHSNFADSGKL